MTQPPGLLWEGQRATTRLRAYLRTRHVWDTFSHAETDEWGDTETTSSVLPWTASGGSASDYYIAGGVGLTSLGSVGTARFVTAGSGIGDVEITGSVTIPAVAATADIHAIVLARVVDLDNWYGLLLDCDTGGQVDVKLSKVVGGAFTTLATANNQFDYVAGTTIAYRFQCYDTNLGASLKARAWLSTEDEPDEWTLENVVDNSGLLLGGVGVRGFLAAGNTNTLPVVLSWGDFTAFSPPQWTDIPTGFTGVSTGHVMVNGRGSRIVGLTGRSTELADIDPSEMGFAIDDPLGWYTPGNTLSPLWPDWTDGVPVRWSETVGARTFTFPDMFVEIGESSLTYETVDGELTDRFQAVRCVDRLTLLDSAPPFASSLAAYIVGEATPSALRAYYPLVDPSGSTYASAAGPVNQDPLRFAQIFSYSPVKLDPTLMNFGSQDGPPGDDSTAVEFTVSVGTASHGRLANSALANTTPAATDFASLVTWVWVPNGVTTLDQLALVRDFDTFDIAILLDPLGGTEWMATFGTSGGSDTALTGEAIRPGWHLLTGQVDFGTGDIFFWVDDLDAIAGNTGGTGTSGKPLDRIVIDGSEGSTDGLRMAHLQLYLGDADAFTREDHLAQYDIGINGWPQQTVDARIRQIATYAGLVDGQLDLEESDSLIQPAAFAGQSPGALIAAAAATGGGIVFTEGDRLVYHDRKHRFGL